MRLMKRPTWYHYACEISLSIKRLPDNSQRRRRFQFVLNSHYIAKTEHDYIGTFSDWEYLLESFVQDAKETA